MKRCIQLVIAATIIATLHAAPADVDEQLIVRAEPNYMRELAARFGLTILQQIPGQPVFLVAIPAEVSKETVTRQLVNYDHGGDADNDDDDDDDVLVENNEVVSLPEPGPDGGHLIGNTSAVQNALRDTTSTNFYGDTVWSSFVNQPALTVIRLGEARRLATGAGVVAVIDTGIDPEHPVLKRWIVRGYDFIRERTGKPSELDDLDSETRSILSPYTTAILDWMGEMNPYTTAILDHSTANRLDPRRLPIHFGHGTMAAGLVHLVAPNAKIMPLKAFDSNGQGTLWFVLRAIYYAETNGARTINMSLSFTKPSIELERAVEYVSNRNVTCVASAGNHSSERIVYPAGYKQVMGIASTDLQDAQSAFTNYGDNLVTIAAPGEALIVPYPGGRYAAAWGTSFSAPLVSGTVALIHQVKPQLNWEKVEGSLKEATSVSGDLGNGRLDVVRAVRKAREM